MFNMVCRLCLTNSDSDIEIFSEDRIQKCITKFLQLELTPDDSVSRVICAECWTQLEGFQLFSLRIEEAQKSLAAVRKEFKVEASQKVGDLRNEDLICNRLDPLQEEPKLDASSDDMTFDNHDTYQCLDSEGVKVEVLNDGVLDPLLQSETIDLHSPRRTKRKTGLKRQNKTDEIEDLSRDKVAQRKSCRAKTKKIDGQKNTEKDEDGIEDEKNKEENILDLNAKKIRGRPKKGEEKPKILKATSEKTQKIVKSTKEFDEVIKKNMILTCNVCAVYLLDFTELKRHFRTVHKRRGYALCCNKRFFERCFLVDHINSHNNPEYFKCTDCGRVMADRICLRNHILLMHQNEDDKKFQCPDCPKKYAKQYLLAHHQVKHIPKEQCAFVCEKCEKRFPTKTTLTEHINQMHSTKYDKMCEICAKLIRGNAVFERHMEEHRGIVQPQVQCKICGSWLKDKHNLRQHMYKHDGKTYSCNVCGKSTPSKSALHSHKRYMHQTMRSFHCTFCDKSFKKAIDLKEHLATHTGEILYTCPHCPTTFNSKANMHAHRKKKHREEWEANRLSNVAQVKHTETELNTT